MSSKDQQLAVMIKKIDRIASVLEYKLVPELVRLNDNLESTFEEDDIEEDGNQR